MAAIQTESLVKTYGKQNAVDNISISVEEGEIFGFLGTNGAGKSTTMMILTTLLKPTSGIARVVGYDVVSNPKDVRRNIGYVQQDTAVDEFLTGRENLMLQARLSQLPGSLRKARINEMLSMIDMEKRADDPTVKYSGGMRKRLDIAGGLLHRPKVLFLDEPTVGLDIQTRRKIWEYIRHVHDEYGITIFLSTHYMEEADNLCDRIAIIDSGRIRTVDTPSSLKSSLGSEVITLSVTGGSRDELVDSIKALNGTREIATDSEKITVYTYDGKSVIPRIFEESARLGTSIESISLKQPTLDDVFITYTGRELRDDGASYDRKKAHRKSRELRA